MSLVARAVAIFKEKGFLALFKAFFSYLGSMFFRLWRPFRLLYYRLRGGRVFPVGNTRISLRVADAVDDMELSYPMTTELYLTKEILGELKPGDVFWDIGANLGFYSLLAASVSSVNVVAFEPNPIIVNKLKNNIALNDGANVTVLEMALSDTEGTVKFVTMENHWHGRAHIAFDNNSNNVEVKTGRGDKLAAAGVVPRPDIVKIDVEGAECLVLKGMQSILAGCRVIFCEVHPQIWQYGNSVAELESILRSAGFTLKKIQERGDNTYHLKATKV